MPHQMRIHQNHKELNFVCGNFVYATAHLPNGARVLEVGAGSDPHPGADVLVDKFIDDNVHRAGGAPLMREFYVQRVNCDGTSEVVQVNVPIVCADILELPFPDKYFHFIIAKDILEHISDIAGACRELSRVGQSGFVDVPRFVSELLWPQGAIHLWSFADAHQPNTLEAHSVAGFQSPFRNYLHNLLAQNAPIQDAWARNRMHFHIALFWQNELKVEIGAPYV